MEARQVYMRVSVCDCVCVRCVCVRAGGGASVHLSLKNKLPGNRPTDLEVTKAWSLMACTTSSNLILVVRVQPW